MTKSLLLALIPAVCLAIPAYAGFEWIPPAGAPQQAASGNYRTAPTQSPNGFEANMVPMPEKQPLAAMPEPMPVPLAPMVPAPVPQSVQWNAPMPTPAAMPVIGSENRNSAPRSLTLASAEMPKPKSDVIEGFGRDVPLTIATRQMIPSDFVVQYGQGVDPNTAVTWSGGRIWKDALMDALTEKNMKATIVGDTVLIESAAPVAMPVPAPMATMPLAPLPPVTEVTIPSAAQATMTALAIPDTAMPSPIMTATMTDARSAMPVAQAWVAPRASTLRQVLTDWCRQANVQLQWSAQYDYPLMSDVQLSGSFEDAVGILLSGLNDAQPRPTARLHPNEPTGPAVLVVETRYILE